MSTPLSKIEKGKVVKIDCVECGHGLQKRLCSFGLCNGTKVRVMKNDKRGPVILKVMDSKMVIGRGQAEKILVDDEK